MHNRRNALYLLMIISLLTGLFTGRSLFFNLAYLLGGVMLISLFWAWLSVRGIALKRSTRTRRSQVGRIFRESFQVRNTHLLPKLWLEVRDHSNLPGHRASHVVPTLFSRSTYGWDVKTTCVVRGEYQLGPLTVISGDPFGFFLTPRRINITERVIVYPMTVAINNFTLPMGFLSGGDAQRRFTHQITTNAASIREYVTGDSMNRIHWKSTARTGKLMVKEFELDPLVDIWLFNDFASDSLYEDPSVQRVGQIGNIIPGTQIIPPSTEEYGVIIAASLAKYFIEGERAVGYAAYTPYRQVFQPDRGNRQLTRILQTLAVARSTSTHSLRGMLSLETPHFTRGTTLIIITSSLDLEWVTEAQILMRRGIRPMCIFIDPSSFAPHNGMNGSDEVRGMLHLAKIPTIIIHKNDDLAAALEQRPI